MTNRQAQDGPDSGWDGTVNSSTEDPEDAGNCSSADSNDISLNRRDCLTALGASIAIPAVATRAARGEDQGYGAGGYGEGPYGDPVDDGETEVYVAVTTGTVENVDESSATLRGELTSLEGADSATVSIKWGQKGSSLSNTAARQTLDSPGTFSGEVTNLESGTDYELYAYAEAGDATDTGETRAFTTGSVEEEEPTEEPEAAPEIDHLVAEDRSNPKNPHVEASADWAASIAEGELDAAKLTISDSKGEIRSWSYNLSGQTANRSETEQIKHGSGKGGRSVTYTVELSVRSGHDTIAVKETTFDA